MTEKHQFQQCFLQVCHEICHRDMSFTSLNFLPNLGIQVGDNLFLYDYEYPEHHLPTKIYQWCVRLSHFYFSEMFHNFQMIFKRGASGTLYVQAFCDHNLTGTQKRIIGDVIKC